VCPSTAAAVSTSPTRTPWARWRTWLISCWYSPLGLMVALAASERANDPQQSGVDVEAGREMPELPEGAGESGEGFQPMGQVYRDPETGRMIMIDKGNSQ